MSSHADKVRELIQAARLQMQQGARDNALELLRQAQSLDGSNQEVSDRISSIEREIAAMEKFNRTRSRRAHTAGRTISSSGFVEDCLRRSTEAEEAGDEVRALQELERARRHDPDNADVRKRIKSVRRSIKVSSLADLIRARLKSGDPAVAVENIRRIFRIWPSAPVLEELIGMAEKWEPAAEVVPVVEPEPVIEEVPVPVPVPATVEPEREYVPARERRKVSAPSGRKRKETAATGSTRGRGGRSREPVTGEPVTEKKKDKRSNKLWGFIAVFLMAALVTIFIIKFVLPAGEDEVVESPVTTRPYTRTIVVPRLAGTQLMLDGVPIREGLPGTFVITDTLFGERTIQLSHEGFETLTWKTDFTEGLVQTDTLRLDTLGTTIVQVSLGYTMPEGEPDPGPEAVSFLVDGEPLEGDTDSIPTGLHVFEAVIEGFRTMPESVYVSDPVGFSYDLTILDAQQAQVVLQLSTETAGNASFFVDGARVITGRRMSQVLPFGNYSFRVTMEGMNDWTSFVNLDEDGYSRTITMEREVLLGTLLVGPEPWSDVYVDGALVGTTPFAGVELEPGTYTVVLSNPAFEDDIRTVEILPEQSTAIQFAAVPVEEEVIEEVVEDLPVTSPFAIQQSSPAIPTQAQARGDLHGYVTLAVRVGADGSVQGVDIVNDPLGLGCGQAAADAVSNWVFSPAMQGDVPVEVTTIVQVRFDIE